MVVLNKSTNGKLKLWIKFGSEKQNIKYELGTNAKLKS